MPPRPSGSAQGAVPTGASSSKPTFGERLHQWSVKAGIPINKVTNKLGSEAFWPTTLELECDKAARILKSFCSMWPLMLPRLVSQMSNTNTEDGFYTTASPDGTPQVVTTGTTPAQVGPKGKPKVLVKIPQKAIQTAAGLAIFTTFRTGLHISGAGGSGIVVSRLPNGQWSPPSGFLVHTLGAGFMIGLDIYDCVCVLRTPEAVRAFTHPRVSLGGEIAMVAGPVGAGTAIEAAIGKDAKPVWSYMKSRGFYAGVQADGTVIIGRPDANAAFYGQKGITVDQILRGEVPPQGPAGMWPVGARNLVEVLKAAEGSKDVDEALMRDVGSGPTPGDLGVGDMEEGVVVPEKVHEKQ
jgi:lipid-binding SYLF domain-containing protein